MADQGSADTTLETPGDAQTAILADLNGTVEVNTGDGQWTLAQSGQALKSGQQIRTGGLSNAALVFYDGSRAYLGADSELALDTLGASDSGARLVQLTQMSGKSQHEVTMTDDSGSQYNINTPAGSGSATGTQFAVMVLPGQLSQFWVESGEVSVKNENATVEVVAGQTTIVPVGQPPIEPAFRITGEGKVMQVGTVGGEGVTLPESAPRAMANQSDKVTLCHATGSATNPYVEITVSAEGAIHGHAKHSGDIIPAPADGCPVSTPVTSSTTTYWDIAGQKFQTGPETVIFGNPQPGDWVSFQGRQQPDGTRFADRIELVTQNRENHYTFIGQVESIGDTTWTVSGSVVQITELTVIDDGLMVGDTVKVTGDMAQDGMLFWADRINRSEGAGSNFRFAGILTSMGEDVWVISGIKVTVDENTRLDGDFELGNPVVAEGVIQENGTWLAGSIDLVTPEGYRFEFIGEVQTIDPWMVSDVAFGTTDWTEIDEGIQVGNWVRVTGLVGADGAWMAESIELLDAEQATSFAFFGPVLSIDPWNVNGVSLVVDERTTIKGDIALGEMVKVTGWIQDDGSWLATEIKHTGLHLGQGCFMISSVVQSIDDEKIILIDGQTLVRSDDLEEQGDIEEGSRVRYEYCVDENGEGTIGRIVVVYPADVLPQSTGGKVVICHYPPGNSGNRHTIEVGQAALSAHLAHGDTQGPCPSEKPGKKPKNNN